MSDTLNTIQTLINTAKVDGELSAESFLDDALNGAIAALSQKYKVDSFLLEPKADEYEKMFSEINENFSSLFAELNKIRSSFLPFELAKEVPLQSGENLSFNEIVNSESVLESYENAFFRMLGMPSSIDIPENVKLTYVTSGGIKNKSGLNKDQYTSQVLDSRQLDRASRPLASTDAVYDLLSSYDPFVSLKKLGFSKIDVLGEILELLSSIKSLDDPLSKEAGDLAQGILTKIDQSSEEKDDSIIGYRNLLVETIGFFGPQPAGDEEAPDVDNLLYRILGFSLHILEPSVSAKISIKIRVSLFKTQVLKEPDISLRRLDLANNFWKYSYLLFPPIQDERIEKCINESRKIVAEPFLPASLRTVNGNIAKSTLLEAVIRIRLDIISGTSQTYPSDFSQPPISVGSLEKNLTYKGLQGGIGGLLESLLVARLFTALYGLAKDIKSKVNSMQVVQEKTRRTPSPTPERDLPAAAQVSVDDDGGTGDGTSELEKLNLMKTMEDSIFLLMGENTSPEVLDLQEGTARSSSIQDAHLMGAVLASLDIPRRWAQSKISSINSKAAVAADKGDADRAGVSAKLGIAKGVGAIDVLAFVIAMFSVPEDVLLSLLNQKQFNYMKAEFPKGFFDGFQLELSIADAVQKISDTAFDAYELTRLIISDEGLGLFVYSD
jgi:hypothetical protein